MERQLSYVAYKMYLKNANKEARWLYAELIKLHISFHAKSQSVTK